MMCPDDVVIVKQQGPRNAALFGAASNRRFPLSVQDLPNPASTKDQISLASKRFASRFLRTRAGSQMRPFIAI
jgi:hypothetical protein